MLYRVAVVAVSLLVLFVFAVSAAAGPEEDGWERFERVPTWVTDPPVREGMLSAVDVGLSNLLHLAYDPQRVPRDRLNLRWQIEGRLRRLLGADAREPALAGARAATVVRKGFHFQRARDPRTVGGQVVFAFVLWETQLNVVLDAIPEKQRDAAVVLLRARPLSPVWTEMAEPPAWATAPPTREGKFVAAVEERAGQADIAMVVADLRGGDRCLSEIRGRLRFHVGNDRAYEIAEDAASYGEVLERVWTRVPTRAWMLWAVPVERILADVPEAARDAVSKALGEPIPPRASKWQAVDAEPAWVQHPPRWPDHLPHVQTVESQQADVARQRSIRGAEGEIQARLTSLLQPVVGADAAERAARAGARRRAQGAHALHERDAPSGAARAGGTHLVTAWTLWHIPIETILAELDAEHHTAAREALAP